jgi:hypothetical protein
MDQKSIEVAMDKGTSYGSGIEAVPGTIIMPL